MPDQPLRPPVLRPGDRVALISPAGPVSTAQVARGVALLESWGLHVSLGAHALDRYGLFAGTDTDRLADLDTALRDPAVRAVICTRGGYGVQRIVDGIDASVVRADPKVVVGYSDITGLHLALWRAARLATVHGPALALAEPTAPGAWSGASADGIAESLRAALLTGAPVTIARDPAEPTTAISVGTSASGVLLGGNLSLLQSSLGTADLPDLTGAILLLEDIGEAPYRVDRMITHLRRAGVLANLSGIALGQFTNCVGSGPDVVEVLAERLGDLGIPVLGGLPIGHGPAKRTVPLGVPATIDVTAGALTAEAAVR